ncbi:MAG TPA: hypothetical protein DCZ20_08680 [Lachnospiraceae bacterium]|nr:hypothetical protein [Lachnospiraceae bacterium]
MAVQEALKKINAVEGKYICLGITEGGEKQDTFMVPWEKTTTAINMKLPNIYLSEEDMQEQAVLDRLKEFTVISCYIFIPLSDYRFIGHFTNLWDIFIQHAEQMESLDFLAMVKDWKMLHIENARIESLAAAFPEDKDYSWGVNLSLHNCQVGNMEMLRKNGIWLNELIISETEKNPEERKRWRKVRALLFKYLYYDKEREEWRE